MDKLENNYSIKLIIKNKIGFRLFFLIIFAIICFINSFFVIKILDYYFWLIICSVSLLIFLLIVLINILRIRKYFKKGLFVDGIIYKREDINPVLFFVIFGLFNPLKSIVYYRYNISGEIYSSFIKIRDTNDLSYLKENAKIKILANPNNKNDSIIFDIFEKNNK
jgi:hypothetical protein